MSRSDLSLNDFDQIGRYVTDTICAENPEYSGLDGGVFDDVVETNVQNARIYVEAVLHQRMPDSSGLASLAAAARRRVHQGISLEAMLRAYRIGARAMWEKLSESRPDLDHRTLTDSTLRYIDAVSSEAERAYLAERDGLIDSRAETTRLLLARLIEDDFSSSERDVAADSLGLDLESPHVGVIVAPTGRPDGTLDQQLHEILLELRRMVPSSTSALLRRGAVVLVPTAATSGIEAVLDRVLRRASLDEDLVVNAGVGRPASTVADIATTVREAERARALGGILHPRARVHLYESMSFFDLFQQGAPVNTFVEAVLGQHLGAEQRGKFDLLRTLYVYFTLGMNRKAAAGRLNIHPNTLDYRLRQATKTCGVDLTSPEDSFRFQLAVRLLPICTDTSWMGADAQLAEIFGP
ncbi:MAG: hypothetical protein ABS81_01835 [Pseudonocardia sp. SCN 72-86]|nr:MAG: hypothetical protein ABS81_01835 [Pseudonocardia sp. SCN 72-86]